MSGMMYGNSGFAGSFNNGSFNNGMVGGGMVSSPVGGMVGGFSGPVVTSPTMGPVADWSTGVGVNYGSMGAPAMQYSTIQQSPYNAVQSYQPVTTMPVQQMETVTTMPMQQPMQTVTTMPIQQEYTMVQQMPTNVVTEVIPQVQMVPMQVQTMQIMERPIIQERYIPPPSPPPVVVSPPPPAPVRKRPESPPPVARKAPPPPEPEPVKRKAPPKPAPVARAAAPPPVQAEPKFIEENVYYDEYEWEDQTLYVDRFDTRTVEVPVDKVVVQDVPFTVEKITYQEVKVPFDVPVEQINFVDQIREVPIEKLNIQNREVPVERVVVQDVEVPYEKIVEKVIVQEVPVERIVVKDVPVTVEKIVIKDVPVPVEKVVERIVEKPVEKIVYQDRIVYQDKIVYQDRVVEVPVERVVYKPPPREGPIVRGEAMSQQYPTNMYMSQRQILPSKRIGVGVKLKRNAQGQTSVQELLQGFGAQKSGQVQAEDIILAIDGQAVDGWELDAIKNLTIGPEGSLVTLSLSRAGQVFQVSLQRIFPAGYDAGNTEAIAALSSVNAGNMQGYN